MRKFKGRVIFIVATGLAVGAALLLWQHGQPRREALHSVSKLADSLANHRGPDLLDAIVMPAAIRSQTQSEQEEFIVKALTDEISPAGVEALKRQAEFGPLKSVFPKEATDWCSQAGVNMDDCVAFTMERAGIRAEVVLVNDAPPATRHSSPAYRVIRCNNVKQMAMEGQHS